MARGIVGWAHGMGREEAVPIRRSGSIDGRVLGHLRGLMLQSVLLRHGRRRAVGAVLELSGEETLTGVPSMITHRASAGVGGSTTTCALSRLNNRCALVIVCWRAVARSASGRYRLRVLGDLIVLWI